MFKPQHQLLIWGKKQQKGYLTLPWPFCMSCINHRDDNGAQNCSRLDPVCCESLVKGLVVDSVWVAYEKPNHTFTVLPGTPTRNLHCILLPDVAHPTTHSLHRVCRETAYPEDSGTALWFAWLLLLKRISWLQGVNASQGCPPTIQRGHLLRHCVLSPRLSFSGRSEESSQACDWVF